MGLFIYRCDLFIPLKVHMSCEILQDLDLIIFRKLDNLLLSKFINRGLNQINLEIEKI